MRSKPYNYGKNKPKGYDEITQQRYEELYEEVEREKKSQQKYKNNRKRPQTAHYPVKNEFYGKSTYKPKKRKQSKMKKSEQNEYLNIVKEYEDVLSHKLNQKKMKK
jgi:hypothetical protein